MGERFVSRGFSGKRRTAEGLRARLPPGQYEERGELGEEALLTFTREAPESWSGHTGRNDAELVSEAARDAASAFVCGSNGFVETAATLLLGAGLDARRIRHGALRAHGLRGGPPSERLRDRAIAPTLSGGARQGARLCRPPSQKELHLMRKFLSTLLTPRGRALLVAGFVLPASAGLAFVAGPAGGAPTGPGLYPDLQTVVPRHLQLVNQQQREVLRFSNGIANTGDGPWALRPEHVGGVTNAIQEIRDANGGVVSEHLASQFEFHPAHNHWHIGDIAQFDVRKGSPTGPVVSNASIKVTFCLIDWYKLDDNAPNPEKEFWDCANSYQGISVGWVDQYHHSLDGQQLDLTGAPAANDYYLVSKSNYAGKFLEKTTANNTAWVKFRLYSEKKGNRKIEVTAHSPCATPGLCGDNAPNR